jgi:hypothetical protein
VAAATDGDDGDGSGVGWRGAPVVLGGGEDVRRVRLNEAESEVESAKLGIDGAVVTSSGELLLRRATDDLGVDGAVLLEGEGGVREVCNEEGVRVEEFGGRGWLTGGGNGDEPRRRRRDPNGGGVV